MTAENQRLAIAASFAERYYNTLVESPSTLPQYYADTASVEHLHRKVKGHKELSKLLSSAYAEGHYTSATIESIRVTCTTTGNVVANVAGSLQVAGQTAPQPFTHEIELRQTQPHCFAITRDVLRQTKASTTNKQTMDWASSTPLMFSAGSNAEPEVAMEPLQQPTTTAEAHAAASTSSHKAASEAAAPAAPAAPAAAAAAAAAPAEPAVDLSKLSFAERLRLTKGQPTHAAAAAPIRVSDKPAKAEEEKKQPREKQQSAEKKPGEKKAAEKKDGEAAAEKKGSAKPAKPAGAHHEKSKDGAAAARPKKTPARAAQPLVFYDIIVKGLPDQTTEEQVRAMVKPEVAVSKVKVESKASRRDPTDTRTFAFIQLNHEGLTEEIKVVVASVIDHAKQNHLVNDKVVMEEVHERKIAPSEKQQ